MDLSTKLNGFWMRWERDGELQMIVQVMMHGAEAMHVLIVTLI